MAQINENTFSKKDRDRYSIHEKIDSSYSIFSIDGEKFFQIDMYGKSDREIPGKVSQTIQFDKTVAEKIVDILKNEFKI